MTPLSSYSPQTADKSLNQGKIQGLFEQLILGKPFITGLLHRLPSYQSNQRDISINIVNDTIGCTKRLYSKKECRLLTMALDNPDMVRKCL